MAKIYIDDNAEVIFGKCNSLNELADIIKSKNNDNNVYFINVNLIFKACKRQAQTGIELLIWLRLKGIMNHCVLHSFETTHALLNRKPENMLATSKGTSYVQMPLVLEHIDVLGLEDKKAEEKNVRIYLKPSFNIEMVRHQEANWWGIKKLWDVHRIMLSKSKLNFLYPTCISTKESDLQSQLGVYIYENSDTVLGKAVDLKTDLKEGIILYQSKGKQWIENRITQSNKNDYSYKAASKSFLHATEIRTPKILHIDDQWKDGWGEIFCKMIYGETAYQIPPSDTQTCSHKWNAYMVSVKPVIQNISELASEYSIFLDGIDLNEFDLVILDLRLEPDDKNEQISIEEISGAIMLNKLRKRVRGVPVLITTASNKMWSYDGLMRLGADAYWMKEGIDNHNSAEDTVRNYYKLTFLIEALTSDRYKFLKYFELSVQEIKANLKWFKTEITWANSEKQNLSNDGIDSIYELLEDGILMLRTFLHQSFLGHSYCVSQIDSYWLTGIINKLGGIAEEIHFPGKPGFDASKVGGKWGKNNATGKWGWGSMYRQDWLGFVLLNFRNAASHNKLGKELNRIEIVELFIRILIHWLQMDSYVQLQEPKTINNSNWREITGYTQAFLKANGIS